MAIYTITDFESIYLTSQLPEEISFETEADSLKMTIYMNNYKVFSSDYYPYYGEVLPVLRGSDRSRYSLVGGSFLGGKETVSGDAEDSGH